MKNSCRILLGLDCNYKCEYCSNKIPGLIEKFKSVSTISEIGICRYENICISGGEPLMSKYINELWEVITLSKLNKCKVFIYTNLSILPSNDMIGKVDGWSIGFHAFQTETLGFIDRVNKLLKMGADNVRVLVENIEASKLAVFLPNNIIKPWIRNDCDKTNIEDWYILDK